jgi:uncharacterized protein
MDVTPLIRSDLNIIQSYKHGQIKVSGTLYSHPIIVTADHVFDYVPSSTKISVNDFIMIKDTIEIILYGIDGVAMPPDLKTRQSFRDHGFSLDIMDKGSACRTYNVLIAEGRKVAVILV